ncbi:hypothetical protein RHABOEDO_000614 [Candidatus Rhabdochlamydia oedothoracis]|uniref:Uncharacterized protein n=1 Tax=Candidatus Rhabdochlamydia oedothoracis TaxID=2720720 RepID=A0ABX8UZQ6_9BACT|nr:hypothetical protein [Candidatus Rhabdochlamydia sp. W815]KAG6559525.1 hypothetical protein RHOW815_000458 [Candidatus Rhabdochlamydia sp. W815]MCL6756760.1 hypothetical protein [Candidatus Rhabdochlamydia oedothoracis]QYF48452.1 hypothetical protein RHABOEDO_000614 [Candidatus Rhabdochlamydia oedothoracis]
MNIHPAVYLPLSLQKQPQNLPSETLGMRKKKKAIRFQKYHQEQESLPQNLCAKKRRGLKRLQEKGLKV